MPRISSPRGFTLVETLVATGVLVTALAGVAQLFVLGAQLTRNANVSGAALIAAQDKLEALSGAPFGYDAVGAPVTGSALQPSPANSLDADVEPYIDWTDASARSRADAAQAVFARRWRVSTLAAGPPDAIAIEVCVFRMPAVNQHARGAEACLSTIRTRQP